MAHIRIATRKSALALWQSQKTLAELTQRGHSAELIPLVTTGDRLQTGALADVDLSADSTVPILAHHSTGKGLFVKEIQEALLSQRADIAVHSMKDLPVAVTPGLVTATVLPRAQTEDVLIFSPALKDALLRRLDKETAKDVENLPIGLQCIPYTLLNNILSQCDEFYSKSVGTTSARRQSLLTLEMGSSLMCEVLRGNVDSRLMRVARGEHSAIILARAGLERLGLFESCNMYCLPSQIYVPAPAQGAIAIECRESDIKTREALAALSCHDSIQSTALERLVLWMLGGDCHTAIGAHFTEKNKLSAYCHSEKMTSQCNLTLGTQDLAELQILRDRERGYFNSYFERLKKSSVAFSVYSQLRDANFETLVPLVF